MFLRPVRDEDFHDLEEMANTSTGGITSLTPNPRLLHEKIERSHFAFSRDIIRPKGESYLFVLEDPALRKVVGCCGVLSKTGGYEPLWAYHLGSERFRSTHVPVDHRMKVLELERIHNGPAEVGTLFLMPDYRQGGLGRLLSLSRFLFIANHRDRFEPQVAAQMRGVLDDEGNPLLWQAVCSHFYKMDFAEADQLRYADPRFIADLVPKHPLYVALLPKEVQRALGKTHPNTQPALDMLLEEGFDFQKRIDIFDGGPWYICETDELWTMRYLRKATVGQVVKKEPEGKAVIVSNTRLDFRSALAPLKVDKRGRATVCSKTAAALEVEPGDQITFRALHGGKK